MLLNPVRELFIRMDFLILLLTFELSLIFIRQWYIERKEKSQNLVSLSYGLYYFFIAIGFFIYVIRRHYFLNDLVWNLFSIESSFSHLLLLSSIFIMGIGAIIFSLNLEYNYRRFIKTKFIITILLSSLICFVALSINTPFYIPILIIYSGCVALFPYIFIYYLINNSLGKIRKKLILGAISLTISIIGMCGVSDQGIRILKNISLNYGTYLIVFELLAISGLFLLIYSFIGFSLLLEAQWEGNIISLLVVEKESGTPLYTKNFILTNQVTEDKDRFLAIGLKGVISQINELSETKRDLHIIDKEDMKIILHYGEKIISALLVKIDLINIHYFLQKVTSQFEQIFLPVYDLWFKDESIFKPMDKIIKDIFPRM